MSLERGGRTEKEKKKKKEEKFPLCVKALVIGPFGAAAQKTITKSRIWNSFIYSFIHLFILSDIQSFSHSVFGQRPRRGR